MPSVVGLCAVKNVHGESLMLTLSAVSSGIAMVMMMLKMMMVVVEVVTIISRPGVPFLLRCHNDFDDGEDNDDDNDDDDDNDIFQRNWLESGR